MTNRRDYYLAIGAFLVLMVQLFFLFDEMRWLSPSLSLKKDSDSGEKIGFLADKTNTVQDRGASSLTWYPVGKGDGIGAGDTVMTGAKSSARIDLGDAGILEVGPESLVNFGSADERNDSAPVLFALDYGSVKVKGAKKAVAFKIAGEKMALSAKGEVQLAKKSVTGPAEVKVKEGTLKSTPIGSSAAEVIPEKTFIKGETAILTIGAEPARQVASINLKPVSPKAEERFYAPGVLAPVSFQWQGEKGDAVELSETEQFENSRKLNAQENSLHTEIAPGRYYWRVVSGVNVSSATPFTVMPAIDYRLLFPESEDKLGTNQEILFAWAPVSGASQYTVEISTDENFKSIVQRKNTTQAKLSLNPLTSGQYYWRVVATHETLGKWHTSRPSSFSVKKKMAPPKLKGAEKLGSIRSLWNKLSDIFIPTAYAEEAQPGTYRFEWEAIEGAATYLFELAEDKKFKNRLWTIKVKSPQATVTLPQKDTLFWRVAGVDEEGEVGEFSAPSLVQVKTLAVVQAPDPEPEIARVPAATPQPVVAATPVPPPTPAPAPAPVKLAEPEKVKPIVEPEKKTVKKSATGPAPRPLPALLFQTTTSFRSNTTTATGFEAQNRGFSINELGAIVSWVTRERETRIAFAYQTTALPALSGLPSDIQPNLSASRFELKGITTSASLPLGWGVAFRNLYYFTRVGAEQAAVREALMASFLVGPSYYFEFDGLFGRAEAFLELAPLGATGFGILAQSSIGKSFAPALPFILELMLSVDYGRYSAAGHTVSPFGVNLSLKAGVKL